MVAVDRGNHWRRAVQLLSIRQTPSSRKPDNLYQQNVDFGRTLTPTFQLGQQKTINRRRRREWTVNLYLAERALRRARGWLQQL